MPKKLQEHNGCIADYYRKSNPDDDKQVLSLGTQKRLADETLVTLPPEIRGNRRRKEYQPESETAFRLGKRVEYPKMIADAREGKIFCVRAARFDRMVRTPQEAGEFVQLMLDGIVRYFIATSMGRIYKWDCSDDIADLMREGGANTKYSMDLGVSVKIGMISKAKSGEHTSGPIQFGFKPHRFFDEKGKLVREVVQDEVRYRWIIPLFIQALSGTSLQDLVKWAKSKRITLRATPERPERPLNKTAIAGILHNPVYKGFRHFDGIVKKWTDEPPVPVALWEQVQIVMSSRNTSGSRKKVPELRKLFIFGSTPHCGKCGGVMTAYKVTKEKTGVTHIYYECKNRHTQCKQSIRQETLEGQDEEKGLREQFDAMMDKIVVSDTLLADVREKLVALHKEKAEARRGDVERLRKEYDEVEKALGEQVVALPRADALGVGHVTEAKIKELKVKLDAIQEHLNVAHDEGMGWIDKVIGNFKMIELAREAILHGSPVVRETVIRALCSNVVVHDKKLVPELRSPFREALNRGGNDQWWAILDLNQ